MCVLLVFLFFFKQKTAYDMRISDWSSDVCSSDLRVPEEMTRFIAWFNESSPQGGAPVPAVTRAAIAHLWFETVHPFEDGNGRLGRAIAETTLAQSLEALQLTALAATINRPKTADTKSDGAGKRV